MCQLCLQTVAPDPQMQLCSPTALQLSKALTVTWPWLSPHSACQPLITAQPGCCGGSLPFRLPPPPTWVSCPPACIPLLTLPGPITPSIKNRQCIVESITPKLPCLTCKASIVSPHPSYSVFFPRKAAPLPLSHAAVIFSTEAVMSHLRTPSFLLGLWQVAFYPSQKSPAQV